MTSVLVSFAPLDERRRRRRDRVAELREAIRAGRYFVSAEDVARSLTRRLALLQLPRPLAQTR